MVSGGLLELLMPQAPAELRVSMPLPITGGTAFDEVLTQEIGLTVEPLSNEALNTDVPSTNGVHCTTAGDVPVFEPLVPLDLLSGKPLPVITDPDGSAMPLQCVDEELSGLEGSDRDPDPNALFADALGRFDPATVGTPASLSDGLPAPLQPVAAIVSPSIDEATPLHPSPQTATPLGPRPLDLTERAIVATSPQAVDLPPSDDPQAARTVTDKPHEASTAPGLAKAPSALDSTALPVVPTASPGRPALPAAPAQPPEPSNGSVTGNPDRPTEQTIVADRQKLEPPATVVPMPAANPLQRPPEQGKGSLDRAAPIASRVASTIDSTALRAESVALPATVPQLVLPQVMVDSRAARTATRSSPADATVASGEPTTDARPAHAALPRELRELGTAMTPGPDLARRQSALMTQTLAERVVMLRAAGQSAATVSLEPESLGRVDVHVRMDADTTHISFTAQHSVVRDVIEANLPRLRLMLEDAGLSLGNVNVGHSDAGAGRDRFESPDWRRPDDATRVLANEADGAHVRARDDRLIDVRV